MKLIFCMQINIKVSYKLISSQSFLQGDAIIIDRHDLAFSKYSNKFVISLQYLKKEVRDGVHFCMQIKIRVFTKWQYFS